MPNKTLSSKVKKIVKDRAKGLCEYCVLPIFWAGYQFPIDHIIPKSKGGTDDPDNLSNACQNCNGCKHNKTEGFDIVTGQIVRLFNPRKDKWTDHFDWDENFSIIKGITPIGRATVSCLKTNQLEAVNLRLALFYFGVHPPKSDS